MVRLVFYLRVRVGQPGAYIIKLIADVIYGFRNKLEFFQPSLVFAGKARAYPTEAPFRCSTLRKAPSLTHKH